MRQPVVVIVFISVTLISIFISCKPIPVPLPPSSCPQLVLSSIAGSDTQTVFMNSPITPINYGITFDAAGDSAVFTISGLPSGVTGVYSGNTFSITGTPTTTLGSPFTYTISIIGNVCQGISTATGKIVVDSCAAINLNSAAGTDSQTVSVNHPLVNITYSIKGTGSATVSSLPPGLTETFSGGILTISGTPTSTAGSPFPYTIITTSNSCTAPSTGLITVTP